MAEIPSSFKDFSWLNKMYEIWGLFLQTHTGPDYTGEKNTNASPWLRMLTLSCKLSFEQPSYLKGIVDTMV